VAAPSHPEQLSSLSRIDWSVEDAYVVKSMVCSAKRGPYCEGFGSWRTTTTTTSPGGVGVEGRDFAVHASVYSKAQAEPTVKSNNQDRRKGEKKMLVLALAGLSSHLCRLCPRCQSVQARGSYPPHHNTNGFRSRWVKFSRCMITNRLTLRQAEM
jgi:hypothetical protein